MKDLRITDIDGGWSYRNGEILQQKYAEWKGNQEWRLIVEQYL